MVYIAVTSMTSVRHKYTWSWMP